MREEIKKSWRGYFLPVFCLGCLLLNCYLLLGRWEYRDDIQKINRMASETGTRITNSIMQDYEKFWTEKMNTSGMKWEELEGFIRMAPGLFENVSLEDMAYSYISDNHLSGEAAEYAVSLYHGLEGRKQEISANEAGTLFLPASMSYFSYLSVYILFITAIETIAGCVLITVRNTHFEINNRTEAVIYTTSKGRRTITNKLTCSILDGIFISAILYGITFILLTAVYPVNNLLTAPVSSGMNELGGSPCISSWPISIGGYFLLNFITASGLGIVFVLLAFTLSAVIRNSFLAVLLVLAGTSIIRIAGMNMPLSVMSYFYEKYNPVDCLLQAGKWFISCSSSVSLPFYEPGTIILWSMILGSACMIMIRRFNRQEL